jgi:AcrR family transcriptional regulator
VTVAAPTTRARVIAAAIELTTERGWASVSMAEVATRSGVSRQTVYNEVGGREALAEAMVIDELGRFLAVVDAAFARSDGELRPTVRAAVLGVLNLAQDNALLREVVSPGAGELLPPLTTDAGAVLEAATGVVDGHLRALLPRVEGARRTAAVDMLVRTVLSHVMLPSAPPRRTADSVADLAVRLLR